MESKPTIPSSAVTAEQPKLEGMEFDIDDELLKVQQSDIEHDQELL